MIQSATPAPDQVVLETKESEIIAVVTIGGVSHEFAVTGSALIAVGSMLMNNGGSVDITARRSGVKLFKLRLSAETL